MSEIGNIPVVILAGGQARRMGGGDKCLITVGKKRVLDIVLERLASQTDRILLNANGDEKRFDAYALPVLADIIAGHPGPLAGILTAMVWASEQTPPLSLIATIAGDTPFIPKNCIARLYQAIKKEKADIAMASSNGRHHPVIGLWKTALHKDLRNFLTQQENYKIDHWTARHHCCRVEFTGHGIDPFFNINRTEEVEKAEKMLKKL